MTGGEEGATPKEEEEEETIGRRLSWRMSHGTGRCGRVRRDRVTYSTCHRNRNQHSEAGNRVLRALRDVSWLSPWSVTCKPRTNGRSHGPVICILKKLKKT